MSTEEQLRGYLKKVTAELSQTRQRLSQLEAAASEPIAIVGMSCRLPSGIATTDDLWALLRDGREALAPFPKNRGWDLDGIYDPDPAVSGTCYIRRAALLEDAGDFDAEFFGISPREALSMDPQQRLMLETCWEAIEQAGINPQGLRGADVGVFAGVVASDYLTRLSRVPSELDGYFSTGSVPSIVSGRVSYTLGLEGPAVSVDTACSSSLTALHLAVQSLRTGQCEMALAGGVSVLSSPAAFVDFSRQRGLAADGRIKSFAEAADGTNWSEGAGVVLVERLADARRNGHDVLAVIRGSALNQDGASNGLTAPNDLSQQRVIRAALDDAGLTVDEVDAVEAHGTGTVLGDPLEAKALLATYGQRKSPDNPLWLGSGKSNLGHSAAAAGITGVLKAVLALRNEQLPKSLHIDSPTSRVDWDSGSIQLLSEPIAWPRSSRARRMAVSSFGFSGTNAHIIVEEAPSGESRDEAAGADGDDSAAMPMPWVVSGHSAQAMRGNLERLSSQLRAEERLSPADVAHSLVTTRAVFDHRCVLLGQDRSMLLGAMGAAIGNVPHAGAVSGIANIRGRVALLFPGQGAQWAGMAHGLTETFSVFADSMDECATALERANGYDLRAVLDGSLANVDEVQPALWAVMVSLARLWQSFGVEVAAVAGHSQGEAAAAVVAGALTLEDAARVVALRSQLIARGLSGHGGMASVDEAAANVEKLITRWGGRLSVAATNGPRTTVVSGDGGAIDEMLTACEQQGVRCTRIAVDYASHSAHVDELREELTSALRGITPISGRIPIYSTVTGERIEGESLVADYWFQNLRQPVRFEATVKRMLDDGHRFFVESSPHPVLRSGLQEIFELAGVDALAVGTLRRDQGSAYRFLTSLAEGFVRGLPGVDWRLALAAESRRVPLPTYAFQRQRYWVEDVAEATAAPAADPPHGERDFWDLVEREETSAFAAELGIAPDQAVHDTVSAIAQWRRARQKASAIDDLRYTAAWRPVEIDDVGAGLHGRWLVVVPHGAGNDPWVTRILATMTEHGADCHSVMVDSSDADFGELQQTVWSQLSGPGAATKVLSLLALDETACLDDSDAPTGVVASMALCQALLTASNVAPLWMVTREAWSIEAETRISPGQAMLWGLGQSMALENPRHWGGLVDMPGTIDDHSLSALAAVLAGGPSDSYEDQVAVRAGTTLARRVVRAPSASGEVPHTWDLSGTTLITGGTGGVGEILATSLAERGAAHLILTSRRGLAADGAPELRDRLTALGTEVTVLACDVADRDGVAELLRSVPVDLPLRTVIHAAGAFQAQSLIADTPAEEFARVVRAKVAGARHLDDLVDESTLDAFVMFSSNASLWGSAGQAAYAAANSYLDSLAAARRERGRTATTISWGTWDAGMAGSDAAQAFMTRIGIPALDSRLAVQAMMKAVEHEDSFVALSRVDWPKFVAGYTVAKTTRLFDELPEADQLESGDSDLSAGGSLVREIDGLEDARRLEVVIEAVRSHAVAVLGLGDIEKLASESDFRASGFDSLTGVELRNRLNELTGLRLPTSVVFDHATPLALAQHLLSAMDESAGARQTAPQPSSAGVTELYLRSCEEEQFARGHELTTGLAAFRDKFTSSGEVESLRVNQLSTGDAEPMLICLPSFSWHYNALYYSRLAASFQDERTLSMLALPGFVDGEALPASTEALTEVLATEVRRVSQGRRFAIVAHSAGTLVAGQLVARLQSTADDPHALVLLEPPLWDTGHTTLPDWTPAFGRVLSAMTRKLGEGLDSEAWVTARAHYSALPYPPPEITTPTLMVTAAELMDGLEPEKDGWAVGWPGDCDTVEVPGDHFTIISDHAAECAKSITQWLGELATKPGSRG